MSPAAEPARRAALPSAVLAGLVCLGGIGLSLWAYRQAADVEQIRAEADFVRRAETRHALTVEIINNYEAGLFGLRNLFVGSDNVTRAEFTEIARDIIARYPGITALEWAPVVAAEERDAFERAASAEIGRPYRLMEREGATTRLRPSPEAPSYIPILYVEPVAGNEMTLGLNLATSGIPRDQARREQRMMTTGRVNLVQSRSGILMVWPIFKRSGTPEAIQGRFIGYLQAVFRIDELFEQTQKRQPSTLLDTLYVDNTVTDPARRILHYSPGEPDASALPPSEEDFRSERAVERLIQIGGREWKVLYRPSAAWIRLQATRRPMVAFAGGIAITALLGTLVYTLGRRNQAIESLVTRRTAELSESRRQLDTLLHALPGMAFRCRVEPGKPHELSFLSEGALALTGYPPEKFISGEVNFRDRIHPEDLDRVRAATLEALESNRDFEVEYRLRTLSGEEKWVLSRGRGVADETGKVTMLEGMAVDVTLGKRAEAEKIALERKLLESQKLESLGVLAGGIAHDFNNLLTTIMGNASLARLELDATLPQQKKLRQIEVTAVRAAELCQQMLAYSGKSRFILERVNLSALVEDSLPLIQFSVTKSATIRQDLAPDLPPVLADATQMRQIIMNLVMNASDAVGERPGEIVLKTRSVDLPAEAIRKLAVGGDIRPGRYVSLEVRDTGCGMSAETVARIFDPFFTTKFTGRGLGLAAVLGIVRSHHGGLWVESTPGGGSTFGLVLPPTDGVVPEVAGRVQAPPPIWHHSGTALVVDDEAEVREVATDILEKIGFTVHPVKDGAEAIAAFSGDPTRFDLVLLDVTMPGMNGEAVLGRLRAANPAVPVVMMSGHADTALIDRLRAIASGFVRKPFTLCSLIDEVRSALERNAS